ncbi:MAG: SDR family oxidoreductase [Alphaproteobacteria bacterium]
MSTNSFSLDGRTIVITGGAGNLGRAFVTAAIDAGARVAIFDRTMIDTGEIANADDDNLSQLEVDVTDRASIETALADIEARWETPHGIVNAAALDSPPDAPVEENGPFETYPEESWDRVMSVNAKGVFLCCQVVGSAMAKAGRGSIVNIASIYGALSPDQNLYEYRRQRGETFFKPVAYSASKSSLYNLTRYIATYWARQGVRTNSVTFGGVFDEQDPEFLERYLPKVPLGRMAEPDDYTGPILFLLSDASRYMTGADLVIDGGFSAW